MVKKLLLVLFLLLLPLAVLADTQVIDEAGLIDDAMEQEITRVIEEIEVEHQIDLVVLVTYDVPTDYSDSSWRIRDYADDFFDNGGYGMGEDFSGMLYMIDMNNRMPWISTCGVMIDYMTDSRIEQLHDVGDRYLARGEYGQAALAVMERTGEFMDEGRVKGSFRYDAQTGQRLSGIYNPLEIHEVMIALAGGAAVAMILFFSVKGAYQLKGSTYKYDLKSQSTFTMVKDEEKYLREFVTRTARVSSSHGSSSGGSRGGSSRGSSVHSSSSGRSHGGGGGRRF